MSEEIDDLINVVQRWESLGLLDGLPVLQKTELAQIFDNATRLMLSERAIRKIPNKVSEMYDNFYIPVCRRLYKRVGPNFNLETMMGNLLEAIDKGGDNILKSDPELPANNPVVDFCVDFSDGYEDELTNKNTLTNEEYEDKLNSVITTIKEVLLNDAMVSYVDRKEGKYKIELSKAKKSIQQTRFWNQSVAKNFLNSVLSEINKGL